MIEAFDWGELWQATCESLLMLIVATPVSVLIGLVSGLLLFILHHKRLLPHPLIYSMLSLTLNVLRSTPFIILLILLIPVTNILLGTSLGPLGVTPALIVSAFPLVARLVENALESLNAGIIDMAVSSGASVWQISIYVLWPEISTQFIRAVTITTINLVAYTAMAGVIGGGGLGDLAIRYGYQRFDIQVMLITLVVIIIIVQLIQLIGNWLTTIRITK